MKSKKARSSRPAAARPAPPAQAKPAPTKPGSIPRPGSKLAKVITLLQRPEGATTDALAKATGWQAHSVRGAISGTIKKKLGLSVKSERRDNGERVYSIA